ncbi:hypothetical protein SDC9_166621 [bioreactor metagenome]|uniref:Uncharacterized protein n=1 Tax=bioreactor metagenome TaxID=1076179 RepID=A0A645G531_9ZZZZ
MLGLLVAEIFFKFRATPTNIGGNSSTHTEDYITEVYYFIDDI